MVHITVLRLIDSSESDKQENIVILGQKSRQMCRNLAALLPSLDCVNAKKVCSEEIFKGDSDVTFCRATAAAWTAAGYN